MAVFINDEIIEQIRETGDIVDYISDYVSLKKSGSNYMGLCPFHSEKTPSFSVNQEKQFYKCFGCGEGGDIFEFCMKKENLEFVDAVKFLADRYNITLEEKQVDQDKLDKQNLFYEMNKQAARYFYSNLINNHEVVKYLHNRNIQNNIINRFGLGFALDSWDGLLNYLTENGYKEKDIEENGLIIQRNDKSGYFDRFRNRVMFPIIDLKGRVIGFGGRVMDDTMPKYLNSKDSLIFDKGNNLYGINLVNKHSDRSKIVLVEGYMDVIAMSFAGFNYAVASLGTSLTERQAKLLKRYGKEVYICYDGDKAGIKATLRAIDVLLKEDVKPRIIALPDGKDPDDFLNDFGPVEFNNQIKNSQNYMDYKIELIKSEYNLNEPEDIIDFTIEVAELISQLESPVEQDVYINKISEETSVSKKAIEEEIKKFAFTSRSYYNDKVYKKPPTYNTNEKENTYTQPKVGISKIGKGVLKAERSLLKIMLEDKEYFELVSSSLTIDSFTDENRQIYKLILEVYKDKDFINKNEFINLTEDSSLRESIELLLNSKYPYEATEIDTIIKDLIRTIEQSNLCVKRDELISELAKWEQKDIKDGNDLVYFEELILELTALNKRLDTIRG